MSRVIEMPEGDFEEINSSSQIRGELELKWVLCPEWPGSSGKPGLYWLTGLSGNDFDDYQSAMFEVEGSEYTLNMRKNSIRLLAYCLVNKSGDRLYPNLDRGMKEIGFKPHNGIDRLATVAREMNGLDKNAKKRAEKNSSDPASSDSSDSPSVVAIRHDEPSSEM